MADHSYYALETSAKIDVQRLDDKVCALRAKLTARKKQVNQLENALQRRKHENKEMARGHAFEIKCLMKRIAALEKWARRAIVDENWDADVLRELVGTEKEQDNG